MSGRPIIEEQYKKGSDVINYVVYKSATGVGNEYWVEFSFGNVGFVKSKHFSKHFYRSLNNAH